jgi:hypothetical protein
MAAQQGIDTLLPVGRIVWGHPTTGRVKLDNNKKPVLKDGKQVTQWAFGVAIPKADFEAKVWPIWAQEAMKLFPSGQFPPKFAWKYKNGDTDRDDTGAPLSAREGYAGHYVISVSTEFQAPKLFKTNGAGFEELPSDAIKCGDFVQVNINVANHPANPNAAGSQAGLYVNPRGVLFVAYGQEIVNGPDAATMFQGATPTVLPPGASLTPLAPTTVQMPGSTPAAAPPPPAAQPQMPGGMGNVPPAVAPPPPPVVTAPVAVPPMVPLAAPPMQPTAYPTNPPPPIAPAQSFVSGDPNAAQFQGYNPTTGKKIWRIPATNQQWETD